MKKLWSDMSVKERNSVGQSIVQLYEAKSLTPEEIANIVGVAPERVIQVIRKHRFYGSYT